MARRKCTMTITDHVTRFVALKQKLGYRFITNAKVLRSFARFAAEDGFIHSGTVLAWASAASSQPCRVKRLHIVHAFALWMHAEDARHEVPPRDAFGPLPNRRPAPHLVSAKDIRKLLSAAHSMPPAGTINPLTWHYLFGLIAATGLRISEALALTLDGITPDGLIVRDTKFRKSRMVAMHPTTRDALNRYLAVRCKGNTLDGHLFVLATGRPPGSRRAGDGFPQTHGTDSNPQTRGDTRAHTPLATARLRRPIPGKHGTRYRPKPSHAGTRHPSRPRRCLRNPLVPGSNACPAARHCRGRRTEAPRHEERRVP